MKNLITVTLLSTTAIIQAQDVKFGKFSAEEISKKESKISPDATAEILFSSVRHTIDWNNNGDLENKTVVHTRIKIFDKDNVDPDILSVEIPLGKSTTTSDIEKLFSLKASTFNPENGQIKEIKLNKNDIFKKNIHKGLDQQTFTFPDVKNGSILEYTYEIISPFINTVDTWYFQREIPVVKSELLIETHEFLKYQADFRGQYPINPKIGSRKINGTYVSGGFKESSAMNSMNSGSTPSRLQQNSYTYILDTKTYTAENLAPLKKEEYVLNPRNLLSSIQFELASYVPSNGIPKHFTTSWEEIGKSLVDSENFGRELNGNGFLNDKVKELITDKTNTEDKMAAIFNFVKNNYKWNKYRGIYTDRGIRKTFNEKVGNVADINLMLVSMLEKAGINANPVVLSTVQNGIINYTFPSRSKLDYVIAEANINGVQYLMDATELYSQINLLPMRTLNHRGFSISKTDVREINLVNAVMSNTKEQIVATLTSEGKLSGTYSNYTDNYFYINNKHELIDDPKAYEKDFIKDYTFEIENFRALDNNEGTIRNSFKFSNVQTDVIGNKIIINPLLFTATKEHQLNQETRNYNIEFGSPMTMNKLVKIKIPEGYKVESLPKDFNETIVNNAAGYAYKFEEKDGNIIINAVRVFPYSVLPYDYYPHFKNFMTKVVEAETQQIVLVKS